MLANIGAAILGIVNPALSQTHSRELQPTIVPIQPLITPVQPTITPESSQHFIIPEQPQKNQPQIPTVLPPQENQRRDEPIQIFPCATSICKEPLLTI